MKVLSSTKRPGTVRRRVGVLGVLFFLVFVAQLALAAPAAAAPFTGGFSPTIIDQRADLNGDGVVDGRDDSNNFYGDTDIIDGMLDCNTWGAVPNAGTAGDGVIAPNDDCILIGYDGTPDGVTILVSGGEFLVADGPLPTVFNATDPDNPDIGDSDFAWSAINGRVDSNGNEIIDSDDCHLGLIGVTNDVGAGDMTDGVDILSANDLGINPCEGLAVPTGFNGFVDLNSDRTITSADSCSGCFFGLDVALGLVQAPPPSDIDVTPATDTNIVGTAHTVTVTVTDMFGNLLAGEAVHFAVTGPGTPTPASGNATTNASGQATFTFTNENPGTNTITVCVDTDDDGVCDPGEVSDTATKTWLVGPAVEIVLAPATDTNPVGTSHTVTATVTDEFDNPVAGEAVHFSVTAAGTPTPASGDDTTDAAGQATFTFSNAAAATNTITACIDANDNMACDVGEASASATKVWQVRVATTIALAPATDTNNAGTNHTVTATVRDQFGDPVQGAAVHFAVTGAGTPTPAAGNVITAANGQAAFTFTNAIAGINTITACIDANNNMACDMGEATITATKTWEPVCPGFLGDPRNQIVGTGASETLTGTAGDDIICGRGGNDILIGLGGNDVLLGGAGADILRGGSGADILRGGGGADVLRGGGGNDRLFGGGGNDRLFGGGGNDRLNGGAGFDLCVGGAGSDSFTRCERRQP
jgi:Ca2+-binding RTX toxin-like protein